MYNRYHVSRRSAFTLIELLVVIAIIAILSVVVILTLNPAELLRQSGDANRLSDLSTMNSALQLYDTDQGGSSGFSLGNSSTTYLSLPDPSATSTSGDQCQGIGGLPTLPGGDSYHCAELSTLRAVNGTGWIPVNFKSISSGAPFGSLPVDPTNTSSSDDYYAYTTNGNQYELTADLVSQKYIGTESSDGGQYANLYEKGSSLALMPVDYGTSGGGSSGISFVQSTSTYFGTNSGNLTFPSATHAGNTIIVILGVNNSCAPTITDSQSDTYVLATSSKMHYGDGQIATWYAANIKGGADTVTLSICSGGNQNDFAILEYAGLKTVSPLDTYNASGTSSGTTVSTASTTTSAANELLISNAYDYTNGVNSSAWTVQSGWTKRESPTGGSEDSALVADQIVSSASTYSNIFGGLPSGDENSAQIVTFKGQ